MPENQQTGATPAGQQQVGAIPTNQQQSTTAQSAAQQGGATPQSFDEWLGAQDAAIKGLVGERFRALEASVKATRDERNELAKQLKAAAKGLGAESEERKALEAMTAKVEAAEMRAAFFEDAAKPEIGCGNAKLAFIAAQEIGAIDAKGRINWGALKEQFPELFRAKPPAGNAGAGTGTPPPAKGGMNEFIRKAAGRT